ncbi:MAG: MMPL family transporter [Chloroflexi bacterium]|nr:MMPL family transporter [Chloroflexota bacterium]
MSVGKRSGDSSSNRAPSRFARFALALAHHAPLAIACWVVIALAGVLLAPRFDEALTGPPLLVDDSASARAQALIEAEFDRPFTEQDLIVFESETLTADDPAFQRVVDDAIDNVSRLPLVVSVVAPSDPRAVSQVSAEGHVAAAVVFLSGSSAERQELTPRLTSAAASAASDEVRVYVTGRSPLITELVVQERADLARAERLGLPAALLILVIASRTLIAAALPIGLALLGGIVTFGVLGAVSGLMSFNLFVPNVATMIGLGVGIDYSLFLITRYREELARLENPAEAVAGAVATVGKAIVVSGATTILSLAGLLLVNAQIFRELAVGAMTAVAVMVLAALTLLPPVLALLGHRIERVRLPLPRLSTRGGVWARWATIVMQRPGWWALASILIVLVLAAPVTRLQLGLDTDTAGLEKRSATVGREILEREFNEGRISPLQVVYVSEDGPLDDADLDAIARLSELLANDWAAVEVTSVTTLMDQYAGAHSLAILERAAAIPQVVAAVGDLINVDGGRNVAIIRAVPRFSPDTPEPVQFVRRVRERMVPRVLAEHGVDAEVVVGGLSAQIVDITDESLRKLPLVAGFIVGLTFLLLALIFRSIVIPIKAILMNVLSIAAAYGLLVVVFQEGAGANVFDFQATGSTQVYLPLLTFAVLFGLSMDYEVFLLGRIKEEWELSGDNKVAVARGLQRTAGVITAAAAIMVAVFAAFTFARLMEVKQLGFSLAAAVLVDATLIRIIFVPAAMQLMGEWNWWFPAWLDRRLPRVDLSEGSEVDAAAAEHPVSSSPHNRTIAVEFELRRSEADSESVGIHSTGQGEQGDP